MRTSVLQGVIILALCQLSIEGNATPTAQTLDQMGRQVARPLRSGDLPADTITVKIVGQGMGDVKEGVRVGLYQSADGQNFLPHAVASTKKDGRAQFSGLKADSSYVAVLEVAGQNIRSEAFRGGAVRLLFSLAGSATADAHGGQAPATATPGGMPPGHPPTGGPAPAKSIAHLKRTNKIDQLVYERGSHLLAQLDEKHIAFLQVLNLANKGNEVFDPGPAGFLIPLPEAAVRAELHDKGADRYFQLTPDKRALKLVKPFPPGQVRLQVTYSMKHGGGTASIKQRFTLPMDASVIAITNNDDATVAGPSYAEKRMMPNATGAQSTMYVLKAVRPGGSLEVTISDIPHRKQWPIFATFGLVVIIMIWGGFAWTTAKSRADQVVNKKEALLSQLVELNKRKKAGKVTEDKFQTKQQILMTELRQVWNQ